MFKPSSSKSLLKNFISTSLFVIQFYFVVLATTLFLTANSAQAEDFADQKDEPKDQSGTVDKANESEEESGINIKVDAQNGLQIRGVDKLVEKLDALDKSDGKNVDEVIEKSINGMSVVREASAIKLWADVLEDVLVPIVLFLSVFGFAAYMVYLRYKSRKENMELIKTLVESGKPIPENVMALLNNETNHSSDISSKMGNLADPHAIKGMKFIFIGAGVVGFFILEKISFLAGVGFIFVMMGAYHIFKSKQIQKAQMESALSTTTNTTATESTTK